MRRLKVGDVVTERNCSGRRMTVETVDGKFAWCTHTDKDGILRRQVFAVKMLEKAVGGSDVNQ